MADQEQVNAPTGQTPEAEGASATAQLAAAVRKLRLWLAVLTVAVVALVVAAIVAAIIVPGAIDDDESLIASQEDMMSVPDAQLAATKSEIEQALGERLEELTVRRVTLTMEAGLSGVDDMAQEFVYVSYRLRGQTVVVADVMTGMYGSDAASMGMLPTQGSLASRMTWEQFDRLLAAYAAETPKPLSCVKRYNDRSMSYPMSSTQETTVRVGGTEYAASDLWAATQGIVVDGDTIGVSAMDTSRKALIFYENPKTGALTFLGTEPALSL